MPALKVAFLLKGEDSMSEVESIVRDLRLNSNQGLRSGYI